MLNIGQIVGEIVRIHEAGTELVALQVNARVYMRMALYQTEPEMGVKILEYLPEILKEEKVQRELGLPEYDNIIIRPRKHASREADIELIRNNKPIARYSVKFSPSGRIDYCLKSWRSEKINFDLLALFPVRGIKKSQSLYYIVIVYIPKILKMDTLSRVRDFIWKLLDEKKIVEGLERLWTVNIREIAAALRDYEMLKKQDEMLKILREILEVLKKK